MLYPPTPPRGNAPETHRHCEFGGLWRSLNALLRLRLALARTLAANGMMISLGWFPSKKDTMVFACLNQFRPCTHSTQILNPPAPSSDPLHSFASSLAYAILFNILGAPPHFSHAAAELSTLFACAFTPFSNINTFLASYKNPLILPTSHMSCSSFKSLFGLALLSAPSIGTTL